MKYTIKTFKAQFPDDLACLAYIYRRRWPNGATCGSCKQGKPVRPFNFNLPVEKEIL